MMSKVPGSRYFGRGGVEEKVGPVLKHMRTKRHQKCMFIVFKFQKHSLTFKISIPATRYHQDTSKVSMLYCFIYFTSIDHIT